MSIIVKENSKRSEPIPAGLHRAVCVQIFDLGTQLNEKFNSIQKKVLITWELPDVTINIDGEDLPRLTSRQFTKSLHKKASLRSMLEGWRGKAFTPQEREGFDITTLIGVGANVQIVHEEGQNGVYSIVKNVIPLDKGLWPKPFVDTVHFSFENSHDIPKGTPDWIIRIIEKADEWPEFSAIIGEVIVDEDGEELAF